MHTQKKRSDGRKKRATTETHFFSVSSVDSDKMAKLDDIEYIHRRHDTTPNISISGAVCGLEIGDEIIFATHQSHPSIGNVSSFGGADVKYIN